MNDHYIIIQNKATNLPISFLVNDTIYFVEALFIYMSTNQKYALIEFNANWCSWVGQPHAKQFDAVHTCSDLCVSTVYASDLHIH